jgi:hypothetical protein
MEINKKNYTDFKIGQIVICVKLNADNYNGGDEDNERLILGEQYTVTDVDVHFHNKICVKLKGPFYFHNEFVPIECFSDIQAQRDLKIDQILSGKQKR